MKHPKPKRVMRECTARRFTLGIVRPHTSASNREKKRTCISQRRLISLRRAGPLQPCILDKSCKDVVQVSELCTF